MYEIMTSYYSHMERLDFEKDLGEKDDVILLLASDDRIQGFSTLLNVRLKSGTKTVHGIFSGDTVLDKEYWGNGALGWAFAKYLFHSLVKNKFAPTYWFLMSKGYKTYLLMTNNFPTHYPRYGRPTPTAMQDLMAQFYSKKYGPQYSPQESLIRLQGAQAQCLRPQVSDIESKLLKNRNIDFFAKTNPDWSKGVELACMAQVTLYIPFYYGCKFVFKTLRRGLRKLAPRPQPVLGGRQ